MLAWSPLEHHSLRVSVDVAAAADPALVSSEHGFSLVCWWVFRPRRTEVLMPLSQFSLCVEGLSQRLLYFVPAVEHCFLLQLAHALS